VTSPPPGPATRIAAITLDEHSVLARSAAVENERAAAIADPLHLAVEENRLIMEIRSLAANSPANGTSETIALPLAPFRRIVKDYFLVCESYYRAIRERGVAQVEAIDAGRRALHNEGADLLIERLAGKVAIDHATARRLFTLLCVLHLRA
jgi:uncharacterized protein (UPF0262 family)